MPSLASSATVLLDWVASVQALTADRAANGELPGIVACPQAGETARISGKKLIYLLIHMRIIRMDRRMGAALESAGSLSSAKRDVTCRRRVSVSPA